MRGTMACKTYGHWVWALALAAGCGDDTSGESATASGSATEGTGTSESMSSTADSSGSGSVSQSGSQSESQTESGSESTTATTADTSGSSGPTDPSGDPTTSDDATLSATDASSEGSGSSSDSSSGAVSVSVTDSESSSGGETDTGLDDCACAANTDVIYVLSDNAELWSFDPLTYQFAFVDSFQCGNELGTFSMGVDRNGIAWVMFQSQDLYTIDVNNAGVCNDPGYNPGQMGFGLFGMAFVSESEENPCDQLYGNTYSGGFGFQEGPDFGTLGSLDPDTLLISTIGSTDYDGAELTGTGDGRLFAFGGVNPAKLIEFDKTDASEISVLPLGALELTNAFAFAFYGGDFYMFTESNGGFVSQVTHLDYDDSDNNGMQDLEVVVDDAPIRIVGAGVSTCVPTIDPQ